MGERRPHQDTRIFGVHHRWVPSAVGLQYVEGFNWRASIVREGFVMSASWIIVRWEALRKIVIPSHRPRDHHLAYMGTFNDWHTKELIRLDLVSLTWCTIM